MFRITKMGLVFVVVALVVTPSSAWDGLIHSIIARKILFAEVDPVVQKSMLHLLAQSDLDPQITELARAGKLEEALSKASVFPDFYRTTPIGRSTGPEHYMNVPWTYDLTRDGDPLLSEEAILRLKNAQQEVDAGGRLLDAIVSYEQILRDASKLPRERGNALIMLVHLYGDATQPFHYSTAFGPKFPKGDRGGNETIIKNFTRSGKSTNLHSAFDGGILYLSMPTAEGVDREKFMEELLLCVVTEENKLRWQRMDLGDVASVSLRLGNDVRTFVESLPESSDNGEKLRVRFTRDVVNQAAMAGIFAASRITELLHAE